MKSKKGITLIALIITIIVMLILVGVTINVALNGGIFEKAKDAKTKTQKEVDKEMLLSAVVATIDNSGNINLEELELPEGFTYNSTTKVYKSEKGNEFIVNETTGRVEEYVAPTPTPDPDPDPVLGDYQFKLKDLNPAYQDVLSNISSIQYIGNGENGVKQILGDIGNNEHLFVTNSRYLINDTFGYNLKTNNDKLLTMSEVTGPDMVIDSSIEYIVSFLYESDIVDFTVYNTSFEGLDDNELAAFKTTYADTIFWFEEVE